MNLKEIAVKCETVEQKKLVIKIMSEEIGCGLFYPYVAYEAKNCNINAYLDCEFEVKEESISYYDSFNTILNILLSLAI